MTPQFQQVLYKLAEEGRKFRTRPTNDVPSFEKRMQIERVRERLWETAQHMGVYFNPLPPITTTSSEMSAPNVLLQHLTALSFEVHVMYAMLGLSDVYAKGFWEYTRGDGKLDAYKVIVDTTFTDEDEADSNPRENYLD